MSMHRRRRAVGAAFMLVCGAAQAESPGLGRAVTAQDIASFDISIEPDGAGLPPGVATAAQGRTVYEAKCLGCHGENGAGKPNDRLVGGVGTLTGSQTPVKTVGSYWPYATTVFDYVRRAMPFNSPKSLSDEEVYAVTAYLLHLNGIIGENEAIDAKSLPKVAMPNRNGFAPFTLGR